MDDNAYRNIFVSDSGSLLNIEVFDATAADWQALLQFLRTAYVVAYSEDGVEASLPDFGTIFQRKKERSLTLEVMLPGFTVNSHFFAANEIELNLLPDSVDTIEKADAVFQLLKGISQALKKPVYLVPEHGSASTSERKQMALASVNPESGDLVFLPRSS